MPAQGRTWRTYSALMSKVALWADQAQGRGAKKAKFFVEIEPQPIEQELAESFLEALARGEARATELLKKQDVSLSQFRHHLFYIARWGAVRRQLLADGGNFQMLERLHEEDQEGKLKGLVLQGTRAAQERALSEHLQQFAVVPEGHGWLAPIPNPGKPVREYSNHEVVWLYSVGELQRSDDLHPSVARSLIRRYLPKPGVVVDPMAGSGTIARMAAMMGHSTWASDIAPREPFIAQHDIQKDSLEDLFGEEFKVAANLVFVHPPTPDELGISGTRYLDWLSDVLVNCWAVTAQGAHVILIVSVEEQMSLLARGERALIDSANVAFEEESLEQQVETLTSQHLAASRDGKQGWHILVLQRPALESDGMA